MSSADNKANDLQQHGGQTNPNQGNHTLATVTTVMTSIAPQISAQPTQLIWTGSSMNEVASQMQTTQQQTQMTISSQAQQPPPPIPTPAPQPIAPAPQQQMTTNTTLSTLQQTLQQQINHQTAQSTLSHPGVSPTPMPQQQVRDQWAWKTDEQGNTPMCVQVIQQPMGPGQAYLQQLYNTQGQLLMPGNLASQPGGMNSPIQVITAGKLGLPNLLSTGPHMLTATSGGKQIIQQGHPGSAAGSYTIPSTCANQTLVIGQLGMISSQPNVLPNSSGTTYTVSKPNDLQKAFGTSLPQGLTWAPQALQTSQAFLTAPSSIFIRPGQQDGMYIQSAPPPAIQQGQPSNVNGSPSVLPTPQMPPKSRAALENVNMTTNVNVGAVNQNIQPKPRNVSTIMPSLTLTQIRPASSVSTQTAMTTGQTGQIQAPKSQAKARGRPGVTRSSPNPKVVVTGTKDDHSHTKVNAVTTMAAAMSHSQNQTAKVVAQMVPPSVPDPVNVSTAVSLPSPCPQKNNSSVQTKLTVTSEAPKQSSQNIPTSNSTPISVGISVVNSVSGVNVASTETENGVKQTFNSAPGSLVTSAGVPAPGDVVKTVVSSSTNLTKTSMTVVSSSGVSLSSVTPLAPLAPLPNVTQNGTADVNGINGDVDGRLDGESHENGVKDKPPQRTVVKPHLLTHVIEGFVIQEGVEPFPLTRNGSVLDKHPGNKPSHVHADKENHVLHDGEPPKKKSAIEVSSDPKCDISKCEFCGKVKSKMRIKASKKFCSNTCAKRYTNLGPPPAPELPKDPENVYNFDGSDDPKDIDLATLNKKWKNAENIAQSERDRMDVDEPPNSIPVDPSKDESKSKHSAVVNGPKNSAPEDDISSKINPVKWTVNEVCDFIRNIPGCTEYADDFALQEIDGQALMLLKEDHLMSAMSMKLGPALKICAKIDTMRGESKTP